MGLGILNMKMKLPAGSSGVSLANLRRSLPRYLIGWKRLAKVDPVCSKLHGILAKANEDLRLENACF